jgi:hypothetical protein
MTGENKIPGETAVTKSELEEDEFLTKAEKFSILSAGISKILSDLSMELKKSMDQFHALQSAADIKKKELMMLHGIDATAMTLKQLIEDQRAQKENLERLMNNQSARWEEEKARLDREEKEYQDNCKVQRQREEEEYRRMWAAEQLKGKQRVEEDLSAAQERCRQMQEAMERDCREREQTLQKRELECSRLIEEIEQLIGKLNTRAKPQNRALPY